jgi:integrase
LQQYTQYGLTDDYIKRGTSKYWYARYREPGADAWSTWRSTRCKLKRDAEEHAKRECASRDEARAKASDHSSFVTLDRAYEELAAHQARKNEGKGVSENTQEIVSLKASHVCTFFGFDRDINTFGLADTEAYLDHRRKLVADPTIAKEMTYFIGALKRCYDLDLYKGKDPKGLWPSTLAHEFEGRDRWLPWDEYLPLHAQLTAGVQTYFRKQRHGTGYAETKVVECETQEVMGVDFSDHLTMYCFFGARFKDLYVMHVDDVLPTNHLQIHGTKTKGAERAIPIADEARPTIDRRIAQAGPDGLLFPFTSGTLKTGKEARKAQLDNQKRAWLRALGKACIACGIAHCSTNDLRRTFATWAWQGGVPEDVLIRWMGHSSVKMIRKIYSKPSQEQGAREIAKLPSRTANVAPMTPVLPFKIRPKRAG